MYIDSNGNGQKDPGEWTVGGAVVMLTSGNLTWTATTGASGSYSFTSIPAGLYTVSVPMFDDLISGSPYLGSFMDSGGNLYTLGDVLGGSPSDGSLSPSDFGVPVKGDGVTSKVDAIVGVNLQPDYQAMNFDFTEMGVTPDAVSKRFLLSLPTNSTTYWETSSGPDVIAEPGTLVLLIVGAAWGGLLWQRRRRKRLAAALDPSGITVGRARASPWWRLFLGRRPCPATLGHVAELTTKSTFKVHNLFKFFSKERVMKVVRLVSFALALLVTAMVSQSRADLIVDMQVDTAAWGVPDVYAVNDPTQTPLPASDYTATYDANGELKGIQFKTASDVPTGGAVVVMDLFADVEDAGDHLTTWNAGLR